jgi:spore coat protein U-like protein
MIRAAQPWLLIIALSCGMFAQSAPTPASATTTSGNATITASVSNNCVLATSNALAFGAYDPIVTNKTTDLTVSTTFSTTCTKGASVTLEIGSGNNGGTYTNATRAMTFSGATTNLAYELYEQSAHTTVWNTTNTVAYTGTGNTDTQTIYGVIPHGQNVTSGNYSDTVLISAVY